MIVTNLGQSNEVALPSEPLEPGEYADVSVFATGDTFTLIQNFQVIEVPEPGDESDVSL